MIMASGSRRIYFIRYDEGSRLNDIFYDPNREKIPSGYTCIGMGRLSSIYENRYKTELLSIWRYIEDCLLRHGLNRLHPAGSYCEATYLTKKIVIPRSTCCFNFSHRSVNDNVSLCNPLHNAVILKASNERGDMYDVIAAGVRAEVVMRKNKPPHIKVWCSFNGAYYDKLTRHLIDPEKNYLEQSFPNSISSIIEVCPAISGVATIADAVREYQGQEEMRGRLDRDIKTLLKALTGTKIILSKMPERSMIA